MPRGTAVASSRTLAEMARELGYSPGEFMLVRLKEDIERIQEWRKHYERTGRPPDELGSLDLHEFRALLAREMHDVAKRELAMLDYFHPKQKAVEHKGEAGGAIKFTLEGL